MVTVKSSGAGQTVILDATQTVQTQPAQANVAHWHNFPIGNASVARNFSDFDRVPLFPEVLPGNMTLNSVIFHLSAVNTATLQSFSVHFGVYTLVNSTSAALLGSGSDAFIQSTASSASWSGQRNYVLTSPRPWRRSQT
jgi:hypothetical protein